MIESLNCKPVLIFAPLFRSITSVHRYRPQLAELECFLDDRVLDLHPGGLFTRLIFGVVAYTLAELL
jgi:hypothetical protein